MIIEQSKQIISEINRAFIGKNEVIEKVLMTIYAGGHVLLEDCPGVGKTTLVRLMAKVTGRELLEINAVSAKVETLRDLLDEAAASKAATGRSAIAFVDEIYHFNKKSKRILLLFCQIVSYSYFKSLFLCSLT